MSLSAGDYVKVTGPSVTDENPVEFVPPGTVCVVEEVQVLPDGQKKIWLNPVKPDKAHAYAYQEDVLERGSFIWTPEKEKG